MKTKKVYILVSLLIGLVLVLIFMDWFNVIRDPINIIPGQVFLNRGYPIQFYGPSNENLRFPYLNLGSSNVTGFHYIFSIPTFLANWVLISICILVGLSVIEKLSKKR